MKIVEDFLTHFVLKDSLRKYISSRKSQHIYQSVANEKASEYSSDGWEVDKLLKGKTKIRKIKTNVNLFEDEVWTTFASLGFDKLNKNRTLTVPTLDQQSYDFEVVAVDSETIILVSIHVANASQKSDFKKKIEELGLKKAGILKFFRKAFPEVKHKVRFIWATKNYWLSDADKERLDAFGISHFDEEIIQYYQDLTKHLGLSARFQLLGNLFSGKTIPELDNRVAAIQGKMGGLTYYSFSVEPEKLLKIGYVLHRNKANRKLMPTYQRIIKKSRLRSVQEFVENGGFFPNSIVINIESAKTLKFERSPNQIENSISRLGILHLPKEYRSAFIIDGQHRLYGYANSEYKNTNTIPVVAFINLDREKQVELFMQINENQKAVPKNLRNTLNADLLWNSEDVALRIKALKLQIAQDLGEDLDSPLYEKIIVGENIKTTTRCITIDTIKTALDRTSFFGLASTDSGSFFTGNNSSTHKKMLAYLKSSFDVFKDHLKEEWEKGEGEDNNGFLGINPGVYSLILIFSDILDHVVATSDLNPRRDKIDDIIIETSKYLLPLISFFKDLTSQEKSELRRSYGIAGRTKYWRKLQVTIRQAKKDFNPKGLDEELLKVEKQFNSQSYSIITDIEKFLNRDFKEKLEDYYGSSWFKKGVPETVYDGATAMAAKKNRQIENIEDEKEPWECLYIIDYRKIALTGKNWSEIFEKYYTKPGEEKLRGGKDEKTKWMVRLETIRNKISHSESIGEEDFNFLEELNEWLINKSIQNTIVDTDD